MKYLFIVFYCSDVLNSRNKLLSVSKLKDDIRLCLYSATVYNWLNNTVFLASTDCYIQITVYVFSIWLMVKKLGSKHWQVFLMIRSGAGFILLVPVIIFIFLYLHKVIKPPYQLYHVGFQVILVSDTLLVFQYYQWINIYEWNTYRDL